MEGSKNNMEGSILLKNCKNAKNRLIFFVGICLVCAIIFARNVLDISISVYTMLLIYAGISLLCDKDEIYALFITCIPFSVAFQYKYALLICMGIYFVRFYKELRISRATIVLGVMVLWELLHAFKYSFSVYEFLRDFSELILLVFLTWSVIGKIDYKFICRVFASCSVFIFFIVLIRALKLNDYDFSKIFVGSYRFGFDDTATGNFIVTFNPNGLGFICNLAMLGLFQHIIKKDGNALDFFMILMLFVFGVMTMSRAFAVGFAVIILILIFEGKGYKEKLKRTGMIVGCILVLFTIVYLIIPSVVNKFLSRFFEEDLSNGRTELFIMYNEHLLNKAEYSLFGIGMQNLYEKIQNLYQTYIFNVSHNGIQEILICWGLPGLMLTCLLIVEVVMTAKGDRRLGIINYAPLILLLVNIQFGQFLTAGVSLLALSFAFFSIKTDFVKNNKKENRILKYLKEPKKIIFLLNYGGFHRLFSDKFYLKCLYSYRLGKKLNLSDPKTFNEKLQWLKLYNKNPELTRMIDKHEAKKYIESKIGKEYVIKTLGVWDNFKEIDFDKLPNQFVLKTTHDSGGIVICKDKSKLDLKSARKKINKALRRNYFWMGREWPYKNVKRRIIAEEYVQNKESGDLKDYKFFCFNGKVPALFIATDRNVAGKEVKFDFYDENFKHLPIRNGHDNANVDIEKPQCFEKMKELASILSKGFPHVRVDFYEVDGKILFGELTFFHFGGVVKFEPEEWDYKFGSYIDLSLVETCKKAK